VIFEALVEALGTILQPERIGWMLMGTAVGLLVGVLPGLGGTVGMSILLPFIFGMDPVSGIALLIGMAAVVHTSDTFPSVLLGVPGSAGSQATIMDGYPLARRGEAARALGAAFSSSMIGGIVGAVVLLAALFVARPVILAMGSPQLFMLTLFGLSMVGVLTAGSPMAGMLAGLLGMLLGSVGGAPAVAEYRFVFGELYLYGGISIVVLSLGLFALPELVDLLAGDRPIAKKTSLAGSSKLTGVRDAIRNRWLVLRSAVLGAIVGFIPGLGGSVVDWIAYGVAGQSIKKNHFGKGDIRGVIAPESANNAKEGGALIPALMFGIPGSGTTAVLLGGLILLGIQAGPSMLTTDLPITVTIMWTLAIANVFGTAACFLLTGQVAKISYIPAKKLVPFLLIVMVVAAYQSSEHWGDIVAFFVLGLLGWFMKHLGLPRAPLLIGFVLSLSAERYLHLSVSRYGWDWLNDPSVVIIGVLIVGTLLLGTIRGSRTKVRPTQPAESPATPGVNKE
jgi:putative tricarboxylic transport membrane protein